MKKLVLTLLLLLSFVAPANGQVSVSYEIGLNKILPGDEVKSTLIIYNPNPYPEELRSITFWSDKIHPRIFSNLGPIPPNSEYKLPFTFKADKPGDYLIKVTVRTYNGAIVTFIPFTVVEDYPKLKLENAEFVLGQKNTIKLTTDWHDNITVKPLFDAYPSESFGKNFEFVFYPEKRMNLSFEIEFKNGNNIHRLIQTIEPSWIEEKGVVLNTTYNKNAYINEAVTISISITNLNEYRIENLHLEIDNEVRNLAYLMPNETWNIKVNLPAQKEFKVSLEYSDETGKKLRKEEVIRLDIINESAVQLCGYEFDKGLLSGQVCNFGSTEVKNVIVRFQNETYFIGTIMPEDYEIFSMKTNKSKGHLEISWKNKAGKIETITQKIEGKKIEEKVPKAGNEMLIASVIIALIIVAVAIIGLRRR